MIYKNASSQKIVVFAWDTINDAPKTGDAANITAQISKDGGVTAATNDVNPTELDSTDAPGVYLFDMTQAETNADLIVLYAVSSTSDIVIEPVVLYTIPGTPLGLLSDLRQIDDNSTSVANLKADYTTGYNKSGSTIGTVTTLSGHTPQTGDNYARLGTPAGASVSADIANVDSDIASLNNISTAQVNAEVDAALADYDPPTRSELTSDINAVLAKLLAYVQLIVRSDAAITTDNATELTAINADGGSGGGDYGNQTEALEAIRDRGDSSWITANISALATQASVDTIDSNVDAILVDTNELQTNQGNWITATGFSTHNAADVRAEMDANSTQLAAILADTNELQTDDVPGLIAALNDPTAAAIADAVLDEVLSGHVIAGTLGKAIADIETDATAILADTNELQTDDVPGLIAALNDLSAAQVNAEVDTALTDIHLDHLFAVDYNPTSKPGAATALLNEIIESDAGVSRFTANALEQAPSGGGDPWITSLPGSYTAGQAGYIIGNLNDLSAAQVNAEVDTALADYDAPTKAELDTGLAALNDPTAATIADAVLDEALSGHITAGTLGKAIADIETDATAILADTNELQTDNVPGLIAALNDLSAAQVNAEMDTALVDYDPPTRAELTSDVNSILTGISNIDTVLTTSGVILTAQQETDLVVSVLSTASTIPAVDSIAAELSLAHFMHSFTRSEIDSGTNELVVYRANGSTEWTRTPVVIDALADPIASIGVAP